MVRPDLRARVRAAFASPAAATERLFAAFACVCLLSFPWGGDYADAAFALQRPLWLIAAGTVVLFLLLSAFAGKTDGKPVKCLLSGAVFLLFALALSRSFTVWLFAAFCLLTAFLTAYYAPFWRSVLPLFTKRRVVLLLSVCVGLYVLWFGACTAAKVWNHSLSVFDFGIFAQMFASMRAGGTPVTTLERNRLLSHFAIHVSPIYYLWLPFYALFPSGVTLEILQVLTVASAVIPLWRLGRRHGLSERTAGALCLVLLLYPAFSLGCFYSVHENKFLLPLLLWTFDAAERRRPLLLALSALAVLAVKEDAAVYVLFFALYLLLAAGRRKDGRQALTAVGLMAGALAWFFLVTALLSANGEGVMSWRYANFDAAGDGSLLSVVETVLCDPMLVFSEAFQADRIPFLLLTLLPLACLPLLTRRPERLVLFFPYLLVNLMADWVYQYSVYFQYTYGSCAFLFYLAVLNLSDLPKDFGRRLTALSLLSAALAFCGTVRNGGGDGIWEENTSAHLVQAIRDRAENAAVDELLDTLPRNAVIFTDPLYAVPLADCPQLYDRSETYPLPSGLTADYIVIDTRYENDAARYELSADYVPFGKVEDYVAVYRRVTP